jgi:hypothetical protein
VSNYEQRDNSGSLFKNDKREKDTSPNAKGKAMIGGKMYYVSAWTNKDKNGNPWQSLSFKSADEARQSQVNDGPLSVQLDDDVPFAPEWR